MIEHRYTRYQRRHNYFVLEYKNQFLKFAKDGNNYGFVNNLEIANAFTYQKAKILKEAVKSRELNIMMIPKVTVDGKHLAV